MKFFKLLADTACSFWDYYMIVKFGVLNLEILKPFFCFGNKKNVCRCRSCTWHDNEKEPENDDVQSRISRSRSRSRGPDQVWFSFENNFSIAKGSKSYNFIQPLARAPGCSSCPRFATRHSTKRRSIQSPAPSSLSPSSTSSSSTS